MKYPALSAIDEPTARDEADLAARRDDAEFATLIRERFARYVTHDLDALERSLKVGDFAAARRFAHGICGSASFAGATPITEAAAKLERMSAASAADDAPDALLRFAALADVTRRWISQAAQGRPTARD